MAADVLADTSALLAFLDRSDRWHTACLEALRNLRLPLLTSEAVLTELFHLIGANPHDTEAAWKFVCSGNIVLGKIADSELPSLRALMTRYADRPMDFADATLVHLAQRESLTTIFTLDRDDFETYRIEGQRCFRIIPGPRTGRRH